MEIIYNFHEPRHVFYTSFFPKEEQIRLNMHVFSKWQHMISFHAREQHMFISLRMSIIFFT